MPGIGDEMLGAMQHAPQFDRQSMTVVSHGFPGYTRMNFFCNYPCPSVQSVADDLP
jgi:hypothetical protein